MGEPICRSILVIDDNRSVRESLAEILQRHGYQVSTARNGADAFKVLPTMRSPVLVLLDLMMPEMDGWKFTDLMSKDPAATHNRVILISAVNPYSRPDQRKPSALAGWLQKPISMRSLLEMVRTRCAKLEVENQSL